MSFLIYAGYVFFWGFLHGGVCLEETRGEASDSLLQFLLKRTQEQDSKIAALEAKMMKDHSELSDRISFLEAKVRRSESAQDMLENTIEDLHEIIQDLKMKTFVENSEALPPFDGTPAKTESNKVILVEEQSQKVESADKSVQRRILSGGGSTGHVVAFYAFLSQSDNTPGQHHTVIFDTEITNIGSAYSPNTGVFTAPMTGVFVFNWNLYSGYRGDLVSNLMVNSDNKGGRRSDSAIVDEDHSSSGCVVVALNQGDEVYVITHSTHSIKGPIISYPRLYESSFSGWLLA
ncbi:uncharacterized protein LOC144618570 [Crassostrea virginica]